jgi:tripartite-type tricarboxylate transporter receptor subunit TctC
MDIVSRHVFRLILSVGLLIAALAVPATASAQGYPTKPVRLIIPFTPGGTTDIVGRLIAARLQQGWGQAVVVENRPGAGTVIATEVVAKASPDGYTLGIAVGALMINPSLRQSLPYDTLKDISGVSLFGIAHLIVAANPSFPANSIAEMIALAKKNPGKISYASSGSGTAPHLAMELLKSITGIDIVHVPYKGNAPAAQDVVAGQLPLLSDVLFPVKPLISAGKLKLLATMGEKRPATLSEYPTIAETVPGVVAVGPNGIITTGGTPRDLIQRISADIAKAVKSADLAEKMLQQGVDPVGSTAAQYDALIRSEIAKWGPVVKASGATSD